MKVLIFISGKRYNGKSTYATILKTWLAINGIYTTITSFSYQLKKNFCAAHGLDFEKFLSDHAFKDQFRSELTSYFEKCNPMDFANDIINYVKNSESNVVIVDDFRALAQYEHIVQNVQQHVQCKIFTVRINRCDDERKKFGWVQNENDDHAVETELDTYDAFHHVVENNGSYETICANAINFAKVVRNAIYSPYTFAS
jgi:phosphomevalonate kinase